MIRGPKLSSELPIVYLAFANSLDDHLATLKDESRDIFRALQPLEKQGKIAIRREESSAFDEIYQDLLAYDDRIVIFHYGGHADGASLELEGGAGAAGGIAGLLGQQSSLKLVFLNGCATRAQVKLLHAAGVPAVIATSVKINDGRATQFSTAFYAALSEGRSIFEAFDSAASYIEGKFGADEGAGITINRHPNFDHEEEDTDSDEFEWALYSKTEAALDLEQWRLPEAREDWRIELSDFQGTIRTVEGETFPIEYRRRQRTLPVVQCSRCGTRTANPEVEARHCPVCGATELEAGKAGSNVPDLLVPYRIEENQALAIVKETLGEGTFSEPRLEKVLLPYWNFDVDTRTVLEAERGIADLQESGATSLKWDSIKDTFDLSTPGFLVPGGQAPVGRSDGAADWHWDLAEAQAITDLGLPCALVPSEKDLPAAFEAFSEDLSFHLEQEIRERVGGLEQKNVSADTRYRHLAAQSLLLPHWYFSAPTPEGEICLLINGQTGAVRYPRIPGMNASLLESQQTMQKTASDARSGQKESSAFVSVFSGVGIGIMVGLLMGLAAPASAGAKTVVGIFIGAVGVGLAALLGLNDRHFSTAKGLRIGSFGLAVAISALSGIYVRDHGLLSRSLEDRAAELRQVFPQLRENDDRVIAVLSAMDSPEQDGIDLKSYQFSGVAADQSVCDKLALLRADATPQAVLYSFERNDSDGQLGWKGLAEKAKHQLPEAQVVPFLLLSRNALCGRQAFDARVTLAGTHCASANAETENWREIFTSTPPSARLLELIDETIDENAQSTALQILGPVLCPPDQES